MIMCWIYLFEQQETYDEFDQGPAEVYEAVSDETPPSIPGRPMPPPPPAVPAPSKHVRETLLCYNLKK